MNTMHLGIEEMIAARQNETVERNARHAWRLADFRHHLRMRRQAEPRTRTGAWAGELTELSLSQARWSLV